MSNRFTRKLRELLKQDEPGAMLGDLAIVVHPANLIRYYAFFDDAMKAIHKDGPWEDTAEYKQTLIAFLSILTDEELDELI